MVQHLESFIKLMAWWHQGTGKQAKLPSVWFLLQETLPGEEKGMAKLHWIWEIDLVLTLKSWETGGWKIKRENFQHSVSPETWNPLQQFNQRGMLIKASGPEYKC